MSRHDWVHDPRYSPWDHPNALAYVLDMERKKYWMNIHNGMNMYNFAKEQAKRIPAVFAKNLKEREK